MHAQQQMENLSPRIRGYTSADHDTFVMHHGMTSPRVPSSSRLRTDKNLRRSPLGSDRGGKMSRDRTSGREI